jgi:hypothetical protein
MRKDRPDSVAGCIAIAWEASMTNDNALDVTTLDVKCKADGTLRVEVWCKCSTANDIDDVIAWLKLAQRMQAEWEEIRADR